MLLVGTLFLSLHVFAKPIDLMLGARPQGMGGAFTGLADDANAILQYVARMEDFMDLRRTIYLQGHGSQAAALVELLRTKEYYAAKPGELIWRVEIWYFQFSHGEWERIPESERVLRRERLPHRQLHRVAPYTDSRAACIMALA